MPKLYKDMAQHSQSPRFVFFGTSEFSVIVLDTLIDRGLTPALIVTAPDAPRGRKLVLTPPPVKIWADQHGIRTLQPTSLKAEAEIVELSSDYDVFIVASYGKIIPENILSLPHRHSLNIHPSLLPHFRGASPLQATILASEAEAGVTIIEMDAQMDHGPIVAAKEIKVEPWPPSYPDLEKTLAIAGAELLANILPGWLEGTIVAQPQDEAGATYTKKITKADGLIDLSADPYQNFKKIQAYKGWPGTYFFTTKKNSPQQIRVNIAEAEFHNGTLIIKKVIPEGKREMTYQEFQSY